jgi:hypothetical protein
MKRKFSSLTSFALAILTLISASSVHAFGGELPFEPTAPRWQAKTNAQVVGYLLGEERIFDGVAIFNGSRSTLSRVQVGCIVELTLADGSIASVTDLIIDPVNVNIAPGSVGIITEVPWTHDQIIAILIGLLLPYQDAQVLSFHWGVTRGVWEDGTRFRHDIGKGFRTKPSARLDRIYAQLTEDELVAIVQEAGDSAESAAALLPTINVRRCRDSEDWICIASSINERCLGSIRKPIPGPGNKCVTVFSF